MALDRDQVVDAAWHILRSYGLGDLSMRRLARELGVQPGALYWHVANKQELLSVLAQRMVAPLTASDSAARAPAAPAAPAASSGASADDVAPRKASQGTAREQGELPGHADDDAARIVSAFRRLVLAVRDGADVVSVAHALDPLGTQPVPLLTAALTADGSTRDRAQELSLTLVRFALGSVTAQQTREAMDLPTSTMAAEFEAGVRAILA